MRIVCVLTLLLLCGGRLTIAGSNPLQVRLHALAGEHILVTLQNKSSGPVRVLLWGSPFESALSRDIFKIKRADIEENVENKPLPFTGRLVKRGKPLPENYIEIAGGQTIEAMVPLARYYVLPDSAIYTVTLTWNVQYQAAGESQVALVTSAPLVTLLAPPPESLAALPPTYQSCSMSQQVQLTQATVEAERMVSIARDVLTGLLPDQVDTSALYLQWFGEYADDRFQRVLSTYTKLAEVLGSESLNFSCRCQLMDAFAFIDATDPYTITVCPAFWNAPLTGFDSKAGTIVHELTHFPSVLPTQDHVYSMIGAVRLARSNPALAVMNANNYEYYASSELTVSVQSGNDSQTSTDNTNDEDTIGAGVMPQWFLFLALLKIFRVFRLRQHAV